jgi:hypothetical protein
MPTACTTAVEFCSGKASSGGIAWKLWKEAADVCFRWARHVGDIGSKLVVGEVGGLPSNALESNTELTRFDLGELGTDDAKSDGAFDAHEWRCPRGDEVCRV